MQDNRIEEKHRASTDSEIPDLPENFKQRIAGMDTLPSAIMEVSRDDTKQELPTHILDKIDALVRERV